MAACQKFVYVFSFGPGRRFPCQPVRAWVRAGLGVSCNEPCNAVSGNFIASGFNRVHRVVSKMKAVYTVSCTPCRVWLGRVWQVSACVSVISIVSLQGRHAQLLRMHRDGLFLPCMPCRVHRVGVFHRVSRVVPHSFVWKFCRVGRVVL